MRKNTFIKMVVSAAAAAYVAVMPVQAEENGEEILINQWDSDCPVPLPKGPGQAADGAMGGAGTKKSEGNDNEEGEEERDEADAEEAQYVAMGQILETQIETGSLEQTELEEIIKKTGYGPHLLVYMKELEEKEEARAEPGPLSYTEEDLYILAHAICGEGQGYPDDEQLYIGSVILNRRAHNAYPNTIKDVVFQRGQYACTRDGNYYREPTQANWRNARWLLENGSILPPDVVYQAGFRQGSGLYAQTRYRKYCYR